MTTTEKRPSVSETSIRRLLPRAKSQRLLITLFGDYWHEDDGPFPSGGLVDVLDEFGIAHSNARAALRRLTESGVLARTKEGRRTSYQLTERTKRIVERGRSRIFSRDEGLQWDGTWTLIAFSVPLEDGDLRSLLRSRLRWLTFWPIYDATWVTPHDRLDAAREQLQDLDIRDALILRTSEVEMLPGGRARLDDAWRLDDLARAYESYIERYEPLWERASNSNIDPGEALVARGELVDDWRLLVRDDPDLPLEFLPGDFPRARARLLFLETYDALAEPARARFSELMATST